MTRNPDPNIEAGFYTLMTLLIQARNDHEVAYAMANLERFVLDHVEQGSITLFARESWDLVDGTLERAEESAGITKFDDLPPEAQSWIAALIYLWKTLFDAFPLQASQWLAELKPGLLQLKRGLRYAWFFRKVSQALGRDVWDVAARNLKSGRR